METEKCENAKAYALAEFLAPRIWSIDVKPMVRYQDIVFTPAKAANDDE